MLKDRFQRFYHTKSDDLEYKWRKPQHNFRFMCMQNPFTLSSWEYWTGKLETGKCDEIPFSTPHSQFSSFGLLRHQFFKLENWKSVNIALVAKV